MRIILALLALTFVTACTATKAGVQHDAERMGQKTREIGDILTSP